MNQHPILVAGRASVVHLGIDPERPSSVTVRLVFVVCVVVIVSLMGISLARNAEFVGDPAQGGSAFSDKGLERPLRSAWTHWMRRRRIRVCGPVVVVRVMVLVDVGRHRRAIDHPHPCCPHAWA